ncbi:MAG: response regulator [Acidimicrobiia bacterium]|nr:response regulator [Acidimicrobiia bacterium]
MGAWGLGSPLLGISYRPTGGHIRAESRGEGHGATFTVTLPVMDASRVPKAFRAGRSAYEGAGGGRLHGRLVLVVDDEADARELMSWALQEAGADVVVAADGVEALGLLSADRPDVVLTDVHMPRMDGFGLPGAMRDRLVGTAPPAIAISARAASDDARRATDAGFAAHLTKPVDLNLLLDTIDRVITV